MSTAGSPSLSAISRPSFPCNWASPSAEVSSCDAYAESSVCALWRDLVPANSRRERPVTLLETLSQIEDADGSFSGRMDFLEPYVLTLRRFEARGDEPKSSDMLMAVVIDLGRKSRQEDVAFLHDFQNSYQISAHLT